MSVYCNKDTEKLIDIREIVSFITRRDKKETNPAVLNIVYE